MRWIEFVYLENPEASLWAMEGTHFTQLSLDLLRDLQVWPGGTVLCSGFREADQVAVQIVPVPSNS